MEFFLLRRIRPCRRPVRLQFVGIRSSTVDYLSANQLEEPRHHREEREHQSRLSDRFSIDWRSPLQSDRDRSRSERCKLLGGKIALDLQVTAIRVPWDELNRLQLTRDLLA